MLSLINLSICDFPIIFSKRFMVKYNRVHNVDATLRSDLEWKLFQYTCVNIDPISKYNVDSILIFSIESTFQYQR